MPKSMTISLLIKAKQTASKDLRKVQQDVQGLDKANQALDSHAAKSRGWKTMLGGINRGLDESISRVTSLKGTIAGLGVGLLVKNLWEAGQRGEGLAIAANSIADSSAGAREEMDWLRRTADDLGGEFWDLSTEYKKFWAATKDTKLAGKPAHDIFASILETTVALRLSAGDTQGVMYALTQMISKGNVQAEELRGQLGERLPGAFQLAAKAMGTTTKGLNKMLEDGQVLATDLLPKLARLLSEKYGKAAEDASYKSAAALNRFRTAWKDTTTAVATNGFLEEVTEVLKDLTRELQRPEIRDGIRDFGTDVLNTGKAISGTLVPALSSFASILGTVSKAWNSLPDALRSPAGESIGLLVVLRMLGASNPVAAGGAAAVTGVRHGIPAAQTFREKYYDPHVEPADARPDLGAVERTFGKDSAIAKLIRDKHWYKGALPIPKPVVEEFDAQIQHLGDSFVDLEESGDRAWQRIGESYSEFMNRNFSPATDSILERNAGMAAAHARAQAILADDAKEAIAKAYAELYKSTGILSQAHYRTLMEEARKERDAFIQTTGDKKTAYEAYIRTVQKLNDELAASQGDSWDNPGMVDAARRADEYLAQAKAQAEAKQQMMMDLQGRAIAPDDYQGQDEFELEQLRAKQEKELEMLRQHGATKLELERAMALQRKEIRNTEEGHDKSMHDRRLGAAQSFAGSMTSTLDDLYKSGLVQNEKMFKVWKAFAVVQALIDTYASATAAFKSMAGIPTVGPYLGGAAAAAAIAAGMARVAAIKSAQPKGYAYGGLIAGPDQGDRADNVTIRATPGEYMFDRPVVRYYGLRNMHALKNRLIPRDILENLVSGISLPPLPSPNRTAYATGGEIGPQSLGSSGDKEEGGGINILNILDPSLVERYLSSNAGKRTLVNVISQNAPAVRQALAS